MRRRLPARPSAALAAALAALAGAGCGPLRATRPMSPEASAYLDSALTILERRALVRRRVDWAALRDAARRRAAGADAPEDTHDAIRFAVARLGDRHSHLLPRDTVRRVLAVARGALPEVPGELLPGGVGYVALPAFASPDTARQRAYAERGQATVARLDRRGACGWILDLRSNGGGSSYAMVAAVGPLLGSGRAGATVDADGRATPWGYDRGAAWVGGDTVVWMAHGGHRPRASAPPVAVLTGPATASAAEQTLVAFRGLPRVRSFGAPTRGVPSSNATYPLPDGAVLAVTQARLADRAGRVYDGRIAPDEPVDAELPAANDAARAWGTPTEAALRWVRAQPPCVRAAAGAARRARGPRRPGG